MVNSKKGTIIWFIVFVAIILLVFSAQKKEAMVCNSIEPAQASDFTVLDWYGVTGFELCAEDMEGADIMCYERFTSRDAGGNYTYSAQFFSQKFSSSFDCLDFVNSSGEQHMLVGEYKGRSIYSSEEGEYPVYLTCSDNNQYAILSFYRLLECNPSDEERLYDLLSAQTDIGLFLIKSYIDTYYVCGECVTNNDCNDNNVCTSNACVNNACVYTPLPDGTSCISGTCKAGTCISSSSSTTSSNNLLWVVMAIIVGVVLLLK